MLLFEKDKTSVIVDDDKSFLNRLAKAMALRGFDVTTAETIMDGLVAVQNAPPAFAIIDMRLGDGNGLDVIGELKARRPEARGVILTGYGNISSAVIAVKLGAFDYLAKPADADEIFHALLNSNQTTAGEAARKSDVRRAGSLGAYSENIRTLPTKRFRDSKTPQYAPTDVTAYPFKACPALNSNVSFTV